MAYAFDRTMNSLGKQPATGKVNEPTQLSSDAGALGGGNSNGVTPNAAPVRSSPGSSKQAFNANINRAVSPVNVQGLSSSIKSAKTGLEAQKDAYLYNAGRQYSDAKPTLETNVNQYVNNGTNQGKWKDLYINKPGLQEDIKLDPDRNLRDVNALANDASIRNRIRENSGAESRLGDSALDVSLLHANKDFNLDRQKLRNDYSAEEAYRADVQANAKNEANDLANQQYGDYRKSVNSLLGTVQGNIEASGKNAMNEYNQRQILADQNPGARRALEKAALAEAGLDASGDTYDKADDKYFNPSGASTDWTQHVSQKDAGKWRRTMDLLGGAGPAQLTGSKFGTTTNDLGFQKEAYLADQRARKAAIDASIGSTGITERAIPANAHVTDHAGDSPFGPGSVDRLFPDATPGHPDSKYREKERAVLGSEAAKGLSQLDPSNMLPDGYRPASPVQEYKREPGLDWLDPGTPNLSEPINKTVKSLGNYRPKIGR